MTSTIAIAVAAIAVPAALTFYNRFVPDVETQKHHLKVFAMWLLNIGSIAAQIWVLFREVHNPSPITASEVLRLALFASAATGTVFFIVTNVLQYRLWSLQLVNTGRQLENTSHQLENASRLITIATRNREGLLFLASKANLMPGDSEEFMNLLNGQGRERKENT